MDKEDKLFFEKKKLMPKDEDVTGFIDLPSSAPMSNTWSISEHFSLVNH